MGNTGDARWSDIPQDLIERIMERVPMDCCVRFRTVCKRWNDILSSKYFIAATKQQCLILCTPDTQMRCLMYSFFSRSWQTISLSFIKDLCGLNYKGSAAGLLLVDVPSRNYSSFCNVFPMTCVCNPVSRSCFWLPEMMCVRYAMGKGIVFEDDTQSYKVVVVGKSATNSVVVEVYNSCTESWTIASTLLPDGLVIGNDHMLFCNGSLYCMTVHDGIFAYNIQHDTSAVLPLPTVDAAANNNNNMWSHLVACKSLLLVVAAVEEDSILQDVIIWEFHQKQTKNGSNNIDCCWKEIERMPKSLCEDFRRNSYYSWFECVGVGEYICFRAHGSVEVLTYSVSQRSWNWLPKCPDTHTFCKYMHLRSLAFEPTPDTKV